MIRTLQSQDEILLCREKLRDRGLDFSDSRRTCLWRLSYRIRFQEIAPKVEPLKSWDVANTVQLIEQEIPERQAPILDMGCYNSEVPYVLQALGYTQVHGMDLNPHVAGMPFWHKIEYRQGDITSTPYDAHSFAAITCVSVIEHGVPLDAFVREVARLLRPGGICVFTADYDASGQAKNGPKMRLYDLEWRIFDRSELWQLIAQFLAYGFSLLRPDEINDSHSTRPILILGKAYTFVLVALRAPVNWNSSNLDV
jgi:SAM-dependent methyltransferase